MSRGAAVMHTAIAPMDHWNTMGWVKIERQVLKLPKRLYRAAQREDHRQVRRLQHLLAPLPSAKRLAVRHVTPDNHGQQTPGVDGVARPDAPERRDLATHRPLQGHASPGRRVYWPSPGTTEPPPVGESDQGRSCPARRRRTRSGSRPGKRHVNQPAPAFARDGVPGRPSERSRSSSPRNRQGCWRRTSRQASIASTTKPCDASATPRRP